MILLPTELVKKFDTFGFAEYRLKEGIPPYLATFETWLWEEFGIAFNVISVADNEVRTAYPTLIDFQGFDAFMFKHELCSDPYYLGEASHPPLASPDATKLNAIKRNIYSIEKAIKSKTSRS